MNDVRTGENVDARAKRREMQNAKAMVARGGTPPTGSLRICDSLTLGKVIQLNARPMRTPDPPMIAMHAGASDSSLQSRLNGAGRMVRAYGDTVEHFSGMDRLDRSAHGQVETRESELAVSDWGISKRVL